MINGDKFAAPGEGGSEVIDGEGCFAIPGLVDIHFLGCVGDDFCDASLDAIKHMAEYEASIGVTSICPATMTLAEEELHKIMKTAASYEGGSGAKLVGINMEGPFISEKKKGPWQQNISVTAIRHCLISFRKSPAG